MLQAEGWGAEGTSQWVAEVRRCSSALVVLLCSRVDRKSMPLRHGQKLYCQILLDQHRYALVEQLAAKEGKRTTSLMREMVYTMLEKLLPASEYKAAEAADHAAWAESVKRRVQGRQRSKQEEVVSQDS